MHPNYSKALTEHDGSEKYHYFKYLLDQPIFFISFTAHQAPSFNNKQYKPSNN